MTPNERTFYEEAVARMTHSLNDRLLKILYEFVLSLSR